MMPSLLDDELPQAQLQAMGDAISAAVHPITIERVRASSATPERVGRTDLLAARSRAEILAGKTFLESIDRADLVDGWTVHRYQQSMASLVRASIAPDLDLQALVRVWNTLLGPYSDMQAAASEIPFTSPSGRERSLVDLLAQTPTAHAAACALLQQGAKGVGPRTLLSAIAHRQEVLLELLLNAGAPANGPEQPRELYDLPLAMGAVARTPDSKAEVDAFNVRCWNALLEFGADVNRQVHGHSLLVNAIAMRDTTRTLWLVGHGANVHQSWTVNGNTTAGPERTLSILDLLDRWAADTTGQTLTADQQKVLGLRDTLHQAFTDEQAMRSTITGLVAPSTTPSSRRP